MAIYSISSLKKSDLIWIKTVFSWNIFTALLPAFARCSAVFSSLWGDCVDITSSILPPSEFNFPHGASQPSFQKCVKVLFHFLHFTDTDWTREVQLLLCYHCLAVSYMFNFLILKVTLCCLKTYLSIKLLWLVSSVSHLFNHLLRRACTDLFCPWLLKISKHKDKIAAGSLLKRTLSLLSPS